LRGFGLKVGTIGKAGFAPRIRELVSGHGMLERVVEPMLRARDALRAELDSLHRQVLVLARADAVCRRLMTVPGVGAVVALTFRSAVDDPGRFRSSKTVGAHFGLTPRKYQSGETDITLGISRVGDTMVRVALYEAAQVMLTRVVRFSALKRWAMEIAKRRGMKRAKVALARKLATVLHRMWVDGTDFRWGKEAGAMASESGAFRQTSDRRFREGSTNSVRRGSVAETEESMQAAASHVNPVIPGRHTPAAMPWEVRSADWLIESHLTACCDGHRADHGRKHDTGDATLTPGT
jgi:Transposase IS116/IS110/IS902 family